ncbi:HmuY family protein [Pedobacter sp. AW31-3R]|uniref:HmuY family protein n=1 Tax=Pedobacter sp. AW31-3R TaxID=3445781 RepID=UPI003F9F6C63
MQIRFRQSVRWMFVLMLAGVLAAGCSKDDDPVIEPEEPAGAVSYYKLQRTENFLAPTDDSNPTVTPATVYFSLETGKEVRASYAKTVRWDLAFGGLYNSFLSGNNGKDATNFGGGSIGQGGILILEKPFAEVTDVPADNLFRTGKNLIGTDNEGSFGEGIGWYLYDFGGNILGDSSYDKMHVAYALPERRTVVLRTAKGDYAKIKMISCYKDAFTPDQWFRNTPHMYFTFEYVIVPKGSTKFEIK